MVWRWLPYAAPLLLVQLAVGCSPGDSDESGKGNSSAGAAGPASAPAGDEPAALAEDQLLVVAFGDSLFAGYGLDRGQGLVPALERVLAAGGLNARVVNAAVSGDTTAAGLQRLDFGLDGLPRKPDLVIVGLGGNDMLRGLDPAETRTNLAAILARLDEREVPVILAGMLASPNMGGEYASAFNPIFPGLAREFDVPLYPFTLEGVIGRQELLLPDGIHPNEQGAEAIASAMAPMVARELRKASTGTP